MSEETKVRSGGFYKIATGFCIALLCEKIGLYNAVAGILAVFVMAQ